MVKRGPSPKPSHLKVVTGNPGKRPINDKEPRPKPALPAPPSHLSDEAKAEWDRVAKELFDLGLLSNIDRGSLAAMCQAYGRWVQAEKALKKMAALDALTDGLMVKTSNGNAIQNPIVGIANRAATDYVKFAAEFGMTPSARSRIEADRLVDGATPAQAESEVDKLFD